MARGSRAACGRRVLAWSAAIGIFLFCSALELAGSEVGRPAGEAGTPALVETRSEEARAGEVQTESARASPEGSISLYDSVAPAVVGITCVVRDGVQGLSYFGTGTFIDPQGLVLSSYTVVPAGARDIRIYLRGGEVVEAAIVETDEANELSLLRVTVPQPRAWPFLPLARSRAVRVGDAAFAFGNAFNSIERDDQVTLTAGILSARLELTRRHHPEATYLGEVLETSAALNNGMDGGPLVDGDGRLIGLLSLNFSRHRWLGTAIPIDVLRERLDRHRAWMDDSDLGGRALAGLNATFVDAKVEVVSVREAGPADRAGLRSGDEILAIDGAEVASLRAFVRELLARPAGAARRLAIEREGERMELEIKLWGAF